MNIRRHGVSGLWARALAALCAFVVFSACTAGSGARDDTTKVASPSQEQPTASHVYVAGDSLRIIEHAEMLPVGFPASARPLLIKNPYEGDKAAIGTGGKLFIAYNCLDCHGADGSGAMGPSFQDGRWHFGGAPGEVFESIYQGRPDGMPAWGGRISNDQIWMLTAYVRSLSSKDLSTENFTGKTIERTGH
ncbi:MAG: cytochrome c oxidase cbb3-type subunit [Gemmatimonadaceae bacterium]|jgi:cytochrome c oxidase cbb3-type subunit 3|nr:cytochrome c oxidase cbb3-type subunit [Gemmatimonadaceae bacterium]